jgi:hypothetical protein
VLITVPLPSLLLDTDGYTTGLYFAHLFIVLALHNAARSVYDTPRAFWTSVNDTGADTIVVDGLYAIVLILYVRM